MRESGLTWSIVRLPFVYGDGDGHLASMPSLASRFGRPAPRVTYSVMHQRDVAVVMRLALSGAMDGRVVNATDDAPVSVFEMVILPSAGSRSRARPSRW